MEKDIYEINGKKYERISSEPKCLGCDLLDEETAECKNPNKIADCMEFVSERKINHFQFKEIK